MLKSLQMKLVLILMLLVIAVMAVVGIFLVNSVTAYNISNFKQQMADFFALRGGEVEAGLRACDGDPQAMTQVMEAYTGGLGLDDHRNFYILDGRTGEFLASSQGRDETPFRELTPNMTAAMSGRTGQEITALSPYFDVALPLDGGAYVLAVVDDKGELDELTWTMFTILLRSLMFGLAETLTKTADRIAAGDFSQRPQAESADEIGALTHTFHEMANVLESTLAEVNGERNKLNTLFIYMAEGMVAFGKNGRILHMNPAAQRMLGLEFDPELTYAQVFPNMEIEEADLAEDGKCIEIDYAANKRILKIFLTMFGGADGENGGIMAVMHDITEQTKLDSSRREFVANVSHELRTPLTNVKGYTETLLDAGDDIDPQSRRSFLQVIYNESDRMTHIVKDLLTLSQLDYGRMDLRLAELPVEMIVANIASAMMIEAKNQGLTLETSFQRPLPNILADQARMEQVIANVISNAVKYNRPGGRVEVSAFVEGDQVAVRVKDTGIGIPQEDIPRLFERFYRVDKARSRERGGTGLGLAIAKEIVEQHNGTIQVESQLDRGTAVTIRIPAAPAGEESA